MHICTLTISFITLKLLRQYILNLVRLTWSQKRHKPRENVHSKIWQSDTSKFFLDRGEFTVYISSKQATPKCLFSYISSRPWQQTKLAVGKSVSRKLVELTLAWSVFRRIENKPRMVEAFACFGAWNLCPVGRLG